MNAARESLLLRLGDAAARRWLRCPIWVRALAPLSLMSMTWWSSSRTLAPSPFGELGAAAHNSMHVFVYAALAAGLAFTFVSADRRRLRGTAAVSLVCAVAYGLVDELHQSYVPGRVCSLSDLASDTAGATLALSLAVPWLRGERPRARLVLASALLCIACVAFATWGPW